MCSYKDQAAFDAHKNSEAIKALSKKVEGEGLVGKPLQVKFLKKESGFSRL